MTMDDASVVTIRSGESGGPDADDHGLMVRKKPTPLCPIIRFGAPTVGGLCGGLVAIKYHQAAPMWLVWAAFAIGASAASGALFAYGWSRWRELTSLTTVSMREVCVPVTALVVLSLAGMNVAAFLSGPTRLNAGGFGSGAGSGLVGMLAIVAAIPAAGTMYGIWRVAGRHVLRGRKGQQLDLLLALRRLMQRLMAAAGSVVALVTFTAGTWWLLQHSLHTPYGNRPPQFVLIFGAYGSAIVGVVYGPAWTALQRRGRLLCEEWYPLRNLARVASILSQASDRQKLEQMLGLDQGIITDLQGGLIILVPLLASAVAAFLPH